MDLFKLLIGLAVFFGVAITCILTEVFGFLLQTDTVGFLLLLIAITLAVIATLIKTRESWAVSLPVSLGISAVLIWSYIQEFEPSVWGLLKNPSNYLLPFFDTFTLTYKYILYFAIFLIDTIIIVLIIDFKEKQEPSRPKRKKRKKG